MKILFKLSLFLLCANAHAAIYKWVDAHGQVNYSTTPPAHVEAQKIKVSTPPAATTTQPVQNNTSTKPDADAKTKEESTNPENAQAEQENKKIAEEEAKLKEINCAKAKAHLVALQSKPRMRLREGDREIALSQEQLDTEIKITEDHIKRFCDEGK